MSMLCVACQTFVPNGAEFAITARGTVHPDCA